MAILSILKKNTLFFQILHTQCSKRYAGFTVSQLVAKKAVMFLQHLINI